MILAYLILSHLLGDFVFQPSKLVVWKMKSIYGILVHVLVHITVMTLLLLPLIICGNLWLLGLIAIINLVHFIVDQAKISYDLKHDIKVIPFVIDQLLHFTTILVGILITNHYTLRIPQTEYFSYYSSIKTVTFISLMVFVSKVVEVYFYEKQLEKDKTAKIKFRNKNMIWRMLIFGLMYVSITGVVFYM